MTIDELLDLARKGYALGYWPVRNFFYIAAGVDPGCCCGLTAAWVAGTGATPEEASAACRAGALPGKVLHWLESRGFPRAFAHGFQAGFDGNPHCPRDDGTAAHQQGFLAGATLSRELFAPKGAA